MVPDVSKVVMAHMLSNLLSCVRRKVIVKIMNMIMQCFASFKL